MPIINTPYHFVPLNMEPLAGNWRQTPGGTDVRMANRAKAIRALAGQINHAATRYPRVTFHMANPYLYGTRSAADDAGLEPLHRWRYYDGVTNARNRDIRISTVPRTSGSGDCYAAREDGGSSEATPISISSNYVYSSINLCEDCGHMYYRVNRGGATETETGDGIDTFNGFTATGIVVQDCAISDCLTSLYAVVDATRAKTGEPVTSDVVEQCRDVLHYVRTNNLSMAICWAAQGVTVEPASTSASAIVVSGASFVNVIDQTVTSRDANSPGINCPARNMGVGSTATDRGKQVKIQCRVLARAPTHPGYVKFIGPDGFSNNDCTITVSGGAALNWYGASGGGEYIYLDSSKADDDLTTGRNKIDIHAACGAGASLYIYGIAAWYEYEEAPTVLERAAYDVAAITESTTLVGQHDAEASDTLAISDSTTLVGQHDAEASDAVAVTDTAATEKT